MLSLLTDSYSFVFIRRKEWFAAFKAATKVAAVRWPKVVRVEYKKLAPWILAQLYSDRPNLYRSKKYILKVSYEMWYLFNCFSADELGSGYKEKFFLNINAVVEEG